MNNYYIEQNNGNNQKTHDCKYRIIEYFKKLSDPLKTKSLSPFRLNIDSLQNNFNKFHILLNNLNINLDVIAITESGIKENLPYPINIQLPNCSIKHSPTEVSVGGALLHINNRLSYKPALNISKNVCSWQIRINIIGNYLFKDLKFSYWLYISNALYW